MTYEWEAIHDELFAEAGQGDYVAVSRDNEYMEAMEKQNKAVLAYLENAYPDRDFRLSKWHQHDFGAYQEVEECIEYEEDDDDLFTE